MMSADDLGAEAVTRDLTLQRILATREGAWHEGACPEQHKEHDEQLQCTGYGFAWRATISRDAFWMGIYDMQMDFSWNQSKRVDPAQRPTTGHWIFWGACPAGAD